MEIKEVSSRFLKGNGSKILIACGGGILLYNLIKNVSGGTTLVAPSSYSGYPDADSNANTIIDSVNQHTTYENELTRDNIGTVGDRMDSSFESVNKNLASTNDYIKNGMNNIKDSLNTGLGNLGNTLTDGITNIRSDITGVNKNIDTWGKDLNSNISSVGSSVSSTISGLNSTISSMGSTIDDLKKDNQQKQNYIDSKLNDIKNAIDNSNGIPSTDSGFWDGMGIGGDYAKPLSIDGFQIGA